MLIVVVSLIYRVSQKKVSVFDIKIAEKLKQLPG